MRLLPSRDDLVGGVASPISTRPPLPAPASFPIVFLIGATAITANALLVLALVVQDELTPWIVIPFLGGLVPARTFSKNCKAAAAPILVLCALTAGAVGIWTAAVPIGHIVNLSGLSTAPANLDVAGYVAPGWRIETIRGVENRLTARRGKTVGTRTVAPLVGPTWSPKDPISIWVAGYAYHSNKIGPYHPAHWTQPGEYQRLVGADLGQARDAADRAAAAQGLINAANPILVMRVDDAHQAMLEAATKLMGILAASLALWLLAAFAACRHEQRRSHAAN
jgi:hypothetical protein